MKKMLFPLFLAAAATWLALPACEKDKLDCPPDLPCATQTGENTFGCYINGKPWVAGIALYILDSTLHATEANYDEVNFGNQYFNGLHITASAVDSLSYSFWSMSFSPILKEENLLHKQLESFRIEAHLAKGAGLGNRVYYVDTLSPYTITLTYLDLDKNIVAGQFDFTGITANKQDTVKITKGRFDLNYQPE